MATTKKTAVPAPAASPPMTNKATGAEALARVSTPRAVAKKPIRPAKVLDPKVQAAKEALVGALAKAQAAKISKPLGKPAARPEKPKKVKMVRDSFTMPEPEYAQIAILKKRLQGQNTAAKKSELLRAGIAILSALKDIDMVKALDKVEKIKTGRPAKSAK